MNAPLNHFLGAVMLLTRAPVGRFYRHDPDETPAHSVVYFPLVGLLVGIVGGVAGWAATFILPVPLAVLVCMLSTVVITGGFHEDGLADAADGLFGGQTPARRLEIMKDSRIGAYGAVSLWFTLTARFLLLQELLRHAGGALFLCILASAHALGRGATVLLLQTLPYVSGAESKSRRFTERLTSRQMAFALLLPAAVGFVLPGPCGPSCLIAATLVAVCAGRWFWNKIGGITGDCLGATNQLVELACYGVAVTYLLHPFSGSLSLAACRPVLGSEGSSRLARPFNAWSESDAPVARRRFYGPKGQEN
ncbi:MAG: adenosylcobinamide-GDP ribazoletransferase, partial [Verrucomicrobia bacterium]|nr:adenosylcobinamide-GDP ribazoletransferase [Verrucomicrobiota bacterium]